MSETYNYLSSVARVVMPRMPIPERTFSLVIEYAGGNIEKVEFQLPPESFSESKGANYASDHVLGRFEPIRMYSNSDATKINFSVNYYWLEDSFLNSIGSWPGIKRNVDKLRALLYPYDGGRQSDINTTTPVGPSEKEQQQAETAAFMELNALNQYVGRLTPPPLIKLFFGDLYNNVPCILTGITIEYKGPWNDNSYVALARRGAAAAGSRFSAGMQQVVSKAEEILSPVSSIVSMIPPSFTSKSTLLNQLVSALRQDKLFPFVTTINITLETNYKLGTQYTFKDMIAQGAAKSGISKIIQNIPIVGKFF